SAQQDRKYWGGTDLQSTYADWSRRTPMKQQLPHKHSIVQDSFPSRLLFCPKSGLLGKGPSDARMLADRCKIGVDGGPFTKFDCSRTRPVEDGREIGVGYRECVEQVRPAFEMPVEICEPRRKLPARIGFGTVGARPIEQRDKDHL